MIECLTECTLRFLIARIPIDQQTEQKNNSETEISARERNKTINKNEQTKTKYLSRMHANLMESSLQSIKILFDNFLFI